MMIFNSIINQAVSIY